MTPDDPTAIEFQPHPTSCGVVRLTCRLWLPQPRDEVFPFFADAAQLETLTPPWLHFQILTPMPIEMHAGRRIDYRLRLRGLPLRWQSEITAWDPPRAFVDEQRRGPYRLWRHRHLFTESDGGADVIDEVDYAVPGGACIDRLLVRGDLRRIFTYRHHKLRERFAVQGTAEGAG